MANAGEWSELYAALKVAVDGYLQGVDNKLNALEHRRLKVIQVVRPDFVIDTGAVISFYENKDGSLKSRLVSAAPSYKVSKANLAKRVRNLCSVIKSCLSYAGKAAAKCNKAKEDVDKLLADIGCKRISMSSRSKQDVLLDMIDPRAGGRVDYGFSIKSYLGSTPTLLNASGATAIRYHLDGMTEELANEFCKDQFGRQKYVARADFLSTHGVQARFKDYENSIFKENLTQIDDGLPEIYAAAVHAYVFQHTMRWPSVIAYLEKENPRHYSQSIIRSYSYKINKLLVAAALGMQPKSLWKGDEEANGGFLIVGKEGEVFAFYLANRNLFESYLIDNTKFDRPSGGFDRANNPMTLDPIRDGSGRICGYDLLLNAQVRFV